MDFLIGLIIFAIVLSLPIDLYKYEIPDILTNGLILIGLIFHIYFAITKQLLFTDYLVSMFFGSIIGLGLFFSGNWGGGDAKLLIGIASSGAILKNTIPFILEFSINLILAGGIYSILIVLLNTFKNLKEIKSKKYVKELFLMSIISLILFYPIGFIFLIILTMYLSYIIQLNYFDKKISTKDLVEGDWVTEKIYHKNKLIYSPRKIGVLKKDIELIKKHKQYVKVKGGIAFAPAFFIAIIFSLNYPDILFRVFLAQI